MAGFVSHPALAIHGGAGFDPAHDYAVERGHLQYVAELGREHLAAGWAACDVVVALVAELEASGLYIAGRGASPNACGAYELDAAVMDGTNAACGAVAALQGFRSPIAVARAVMDNSPYVLLAGEGAAAFAAAHGAAGIPPLEQWFTPACLGEQLGSQQAVHGTVGCVARDNAGRLAAAVSTGGIFGKQPGRVGDTPLVGAGCWADERVAVVCTGQGEYFIRTAVAARIAHRIEFGGLGLASSSCSRSAEQGQRVGGSRRPDRRRLPWQFGS